MKDILSRIDKAFLGLVFFLFVINLPFFLNLTFPQHDTLYSFVMFHSIYSDFFYNNELMQWLPYSTYGVQFDFLQLGLLSAVSYFAILIGGILKIKGVLFLYKTSFFLEQLIFLWGLYLLSRELYRNRTTVFFVCAGAVGSLLLLRQVGFNFYTYYLLPLMMYLFFMFFKKYRLRHLAMMLNIFVLSLLGRAPYFMIITGMELFIVFAVLSLNHYRELLRPFKTATRQEIFVTSGFLMSFSLLMSAFLYLAFHQTDHIKILSIGRDPVTGMTPLNVFLTYGGQLGYKKFFDLIVPGILSTYEDMTLYVGLLVLPFAIYGILKVRAPMLKAFVTVVVVMGLFSVGGFVSQILYYIVPGMKYYRHIGLSIGSFKMFLPLIAGFGLDYFLEHARTNFFSSGKIAVSIILLSGALIFYFATNDPVIERIALVYGFLIVVIIFVLFVFFKNLSLKEHFILFLLVGVCSELIGYQATAASRYVISTAMAENFETINKMEFQQERTPGPPNQSSANYFSSIYSLVTKYGSAVYTSYLNFIQWDSCITPFRTDFINSHVALLLESKGNEPGIFSFNLRIDFNFLNSVGCMSPKLKLISNVIFTDSEQEAVRLVQNTKDINEVVILNNVPLDIQSRWNNYQKSSGTITVIDFSANRIDLEAAVPEMTGAWLYYADAFHPAWKAFVNGSPTPIAQANVGFKAIKLERGVSKIRFIYDNKMTKYSFYILIIAGVIFTCICLFRMMSLYYIQK